MAGYYDPLTGAWIEEGVSEEQVQAQQSAPVPPPPAAAGPDMTQDTQAYQAAPAPLPEYTAQESAGYQLGMGQAPAWEEPLYPLDARTNYVEAEAPVSQYTEPSYAAPGSTNVHEGYDSWAGNYPVDQGVDIGGGPVKGDGVLSPGETIYDSWEDMGGGPVPYPKGSPNTPGVSQFYGAGASVDGVVTPRSVRGSPGPNSGTFTIQPVPVPRSKTYDDQAAVASRYGAFRPGNGEMDNVGIQGPGQLSPTRNQPAGYYESTQDRTLPSPIDKSYVEDDIKEITNAPTYLKDAEARWSPSDVDRQFIRDDVAADRERQATIDWLMNEAGYDEKQATEFLEPDWTAMLMTMGPGGVVDDAIMAGIQAGKRALPHAGNAARAVQGVLGFADDAAKSVDNAPAAPKSGAPGVPRSEQPPLFESVSAPESGAPSVPDRIRVVEDSSQFTPVDPATGKAIKSGGGLLSTEEVAASVAKGGMKATRDYAKQNKLDLDLAESVMKGEMTYADAVSTQATRGATAPPPKRGGKGKKAAPSPVEESAPVVQSPGAAPRLGQLPTIKTPARITPSSGRPASRPGQPNLTTNLPPVKTPARQAPSSAPQRTTPAGSTTPFPVTTPARPTAPGSRSTTPFPSTSPAPSGTTAPVARPAARPATGAPTAPAATAPRPRPTGKPVAFEVLRNAGLGAVAGLGGLTVGNAIMNSQGGRRGAEAEGSDTDRPVATPRSVGQPNGRVNVDEHVKASGVDPSTVRTTDRGIIVSVDKDGNQTRIGIDTGGGTMETISEDATDEEVLARADAIKAEREAASQQITNTPEPTGVVGPAATGGNGGVAPAPSPASGQPLRTDTADNFIEDYTSGGGNEGRDYYGGSDGYSRSSGSYRRKSRRSRGKSSGSSPMFGEGFPFDRQNSEMRNMILAIINESMNKSKGSDKRSNR